MCDCFDCEIQIDEYFFFVDWYNFQEEVESDEGQEREV